MAVPNFDNNINTGFWAQNAGVNSGKGTNPADYLKWVDIFYNGQLITQIQKANNTTTESPDSVFDRWIHTQATAVSGGPSAWWGTYQAEKTQNESQQNAFDFLDNTFQQYGLGALANKIKEYILAGYTGDTIALKLVETPEYKTRFAGNETRKQKGLSVLSPAEYIGLEDQYKDLFRQYGLPAGIYDTSDSIAKYIGNDVSAAEMDGRLQLARRTVRADNPSTKNAYMQWYAAGLTEGDAIAAVLDPARAIPELERRQRSAGIKGWADFHGQGNDVSIGTAEFLGDKGVSEEEADRGFAAIGQFVNPTKKFARRYGQDYQSADAQSEVFFNSGAAREKREKLFNREIAEFSGGQKVTPKSFGEGRY